MDEYQNTRLLDIIKHLQNKGFDTYLPGKHQGECLSEYVVVKTGETTQAMEYSSTVTYYDVMCYVPEKFPSRLDAMVDEVVAAMKELNPMIRPTYNITGHFYDDTVKGHMRSITYLNYRKL